MQTKKLFQTLLLAVIMAGFSLSSINCAAKIVPPPVPLDGVDMYDGRVKGDVCFTPMYLNNYLQWKHDNCLK